MSTEPSAPAAPQQLNADTEEIDINNPPFPLTTIDRTLLAMPDEDFHRITWADLEQIIASNTLENLKRLPSDLRRYLAWSHRTKQQYGSITNFVVRERLHWTPSPSSSSSSSSADPASPPSFPHHSATPFADRRDYAILRNDWPYGLAAGIVHLVVWSKTPIAVDLTRGGDVTAASRATIEGFVARQFARDVGPGNVRWFKNWVALQSVRGVDHVHILVRDVPAEVLERWCERRDERES